MEINKVEFCRVNAINQITIPKKIRDEFNINVEGDQKVLLEVKFIRVIKPTSEEDTVEEIVSNNIEESEPIERKESNNIEETNEEN